MNFIYQLLMYLGAIVVYALVVGLLTYFIAWLNLRREPYSYDDEEYLLTVVVIQALIAMFFIAYMIIRI